MSAHRELWKTLRWVSLLTALLALAWLGVRVFEHTTARTEAAVSRSLDKVLGALTHSDTRVVEGRAEIVEKSEISELALMELKMSADRTFENQTYFLHTLPSGTKRLSVRGDYRVTAGYRLVPGTSLGMENGQAVARFPEPRILGIELTNFQVLNEKNGWANSITAEDRETILRELRAQMTQEARKSGVLDTVEATLHRRLSDLLGGAEIRIERTEKPLAKAL